MPPKLHAARKGNKKAAKSELLSYASTVEPISDSEPSTPATTIKIEEEGSPSASGSFSNSVSAMFDKRCTKAMDMPTKNPFAKEILLAKDRIPAIDCFPFKGLSSSTHDFLSESKTKDPAPKGKAKSSTSPKKTKTGEREFTAAELGQYILQGLPGLHDSEEVSTFERNIQQAQTEKAVRFFKDNTCDKHFIPIPVDPLVDHDNWCEWMVAMQLLFVQHGVWDVAIGKIRPLSASHPLHLWYQRMCDCVVGLVFANVSKPIRTHLCSLGAAAEIDPEALMQCLWVHYGDPDGEKVPH